MERPTWHKRPTISRATTHRPDTPTYVPKPAESLGVIIKDHATQTAREEMVYELWARYGSERILVNLVERLKAQEGLYDPK